MQRLEVSRAVRPIYGSLGLKRLSMVLRQLHVYSSLPLHMCKHNETMTIKRAPFIRYEYHLSMYSSEIHPAITNLGQVALLKGLLRTQNQCYQCLDTKVRLG